MSRIKVPKRIVLLLMLVLGAGMVQGQPPCTPYPLPYYENFSNAPQVNVYDTVGHNQCWTLFRSTPWACSYEYDVMWSSILGGGQQKFCNLEAGYLFCDDDQNGYIDNYTLYQHTVVSPPLATSPVKIEFLAHNYSSETETPVYLIVGFIADMGSIATSFVAFDTLLIESNEFGVFNEYTLIVPDTLTTPCYIAFRLDTNLQRTMHPVDDTNNIFFPFGLGPASIFLDNVFLDDFRFIPRTYIQIDYYDTICKGEGFEGHGFVVAPGQVTGTYKRDSSDACTTWHHVLHLCVIAPTTEEYHIVLAPGDTFYVGGTALTQAGDYTFPLQNRFGCDSTIIVHIDIKTNPEGPVIIDSTALNWPVWFPNAFTPGEETNNRFGCVTDLTISRFKLDIYTREGLLVFHSDDPSRSWDGTHNGVALPQATYVYRCYMRLNSGHSMEKTGTVLLLR